MAKIRGLLEECRVQGDEVDREMEALKLQREMERGIWEKLRGRKESG